MGLIDTHTHLESFVRKGTAASALSRAKAAGLEAMITVGTSPHDWTLYRDLAKRLTGFVYYSIGLHPCSVDEHWEMAMAQVEGFWPKEGEGDNHPVALGEVGLDRYHLPKDNPHEAKKIFGWQRAAFEASLAIAKRLGTPVIIHARGAFQECVEMIDASGVDWTKVIFHCFSEGVPEMNELLRRGGYGSFTGILTYKSADIVREAALSQGLDRFMVETDAPYLTPDPKRGKPNEPAFVKYTAEFAATHVFQKSYAEIEKRSTENAKRFFGLP